MIKIYVLIDPIDNLPKYIGKTKGTLVRRLQGHLSSLKTSTMKNNWIKSLLNKGLTPSIELLDEVPFSEWELFEQYWISQFKTWGFVLKNMTEGGDGNKGQVFSKESIEKRSKALRGKPRPEEVKAKISKSHTGKVMKNSTKEKLRQFNLGKKYDLESRKKKWKAVLQFSIEGEFLKEWSYIREAADCLNISPGSIQNSCCGRAKTAGGFKWRYK